MFPVHSRTTSFFWFLALGLLCSLVSAQEAPAERKTPWTTSNVVGSPDPPLPYKTVRVFEGVQLDHPTDVAWAPTAQRFVATQLKGQLVAFPNAPESAVTQPFLNLNDCHEKPISQALATLFHHDLENHPWFFVTYSYTGKDDHGVLLTRFRVTDASKPAVDPASRTVLASWSSGGHTGGSMQFGPDGMLYVSIGDGQPPYPPDAERVGQDLTNLQSTVIRIDVDHPTQESPYQIPDDNPFVDQPGVRKEIWAYGFRNPWKIAFDPQSGDLLAADVGWEMREMIHRVDRGRNHGWSIMEGSQSVKPDETPTIPITKPLYEHTHLDSRSITGGYYWQSDRIAELKGAYIYGDWMTGKVWALKHDRDRVIWQKELVDTQLQIICFMQDADGEVYIVGYDGTILQLQPNDQPSSVESFPTRLSGTGLFSDVASQTPATGVVEYQISSPHWADGTHSRQWIGLPGDSQLTLYDRDNWQTGQTKGRFDFPQNTVVAKTVSYLADPSNPDSVRHLETQILHLLGDDWRAYNYVWNDQQTDAVLQEDIAVERKITIKDSSAEGGLRSQTWRHSSRSECLLCHIWAAGTVHAFWPEQLNIATLQGNQIDQLTELGLFAESIPKVTPLASPHDDSRSIEDRARAYLAMNCSTCHRKQGGGTADFNFNPTRSLAQNNFINAVPLQGTFGVPDARVVAPGDPYRSILLYRTMKTGRGHMPQFGSNVIDLSGVRLLRDWIASMPADPEHQADVDYQESFDKLANLPRSDAEIAECLSSPQSALAMALACSEDTTSETTRAALVEQAVKSENPLVRDLFEHYLPEERRIKRLGLDFDEQQLLSMKGSIERGRVLFESAADINCRSCHQIGKVGQTVGPSLGGIGLQMTPAELLTSIRQPSQKISPEYVTRTVLAADGEVVAGIVLKETDQELTIADATGKARTLLVDEIEAVRRSTKSIMPEQLLAGMTAQQAADLIAFLMDQREPGPSNHKRTLVKRSKNAIVVDGVLDQDEWADAETINNFVFTWWKDGDPPQQSTAAKMLWDDQCLYVAFKCEDQDIQATRTVRDSDVYRDDCVEVFASPQNDHPENYFNIEMNARGVMLDNYRPKGKNPNSDWNPKGIRCAVKIDGTLNDSSDTDQGWTLEVAIPFQLFNEVLPDGKPIPGDTWRLNLNRLDDAMKVKSQWSRGDRNFPRFHHPEFFGTVEFVDR